MMIPGDPKTAERDTTRMLVIDPAARSTAIATVADLPQFLRHGDLVVLNDAATLPASLQARSERGEPLELRLLGPARADRFDAVSLGAGDFRTRTEDRPPPPALPVGARLSVGPELHAQIRALSALSPRLLEIQFDREGPELWRALYAAGRPIQYAYQREPLELWSVQTVYASRPWAAEMPSAGRPLSFRTLLGLKRRGIRLARLTHAAGLSSTGDPAIDRALPLPERYDIPAETAAAVMATRARAGRILAIGTSVVRALESAALRGSGTIPSGEAISDLKIQPHTRLQIVDGILSGIHSPEESHYQLLGALADPQTLDLAHNQAQRHDLRVHEFGDSCLIMPESLTSAARAA